MVTLAAFNKEVDLTALVVRVVDMAKGLDRGARSAVQGTTAGGADKLLSQTLAVSMDEHRRRSDMESPPRLTLKQVEEELRKAEEKFS